MLSSNYKKYDRSPKSIDLDFKNPRLIGYLKREALNSQKDLIIALAHHYDVMDLCANIVNNGYHLDETLIVIPDEAGKQNRVTVLEGNRRLSACKILQRPDLLKGTPLYSKVSRLIKHPNYQAALKSIARITVVEIEGRAEAFAYIASKHTKDNIKSWSPYTQGAYYLSFKTPGTTLLNIREMLGGAVDLSIIKHRVLFYRLGEYILELDCWSLDEREKLISSIDKLKIEAIIRLIGRSDFKKSIGIIGIDEYGDLFCESINSAEFDLLMEKLARSSHFANDGQFVLSTRQEKEDEIIDYLSECSAAMQNASDGDIKVGARLYITPKENKDITVESTESENKSSSKKARKIKMLLDKEVITFPQAYPKLLVLVEEATKLRLASHIHTSALLSRAIMEITLKVWIKYKSQESALKKEYKDKAFDFANLLKFLEKNSPLLIDDDNDAMKALRSAADGLLQRDKEILNLTNHNDYHLISKSELDSITNKLELFATYFFPRLVTNR